MGQLFPQPRECSLVVHAFAEAEALAEGARLIEVVLCHGGSEALILILCPHVFKQVLHLF